MKNKANRIVERNLETLSKMEKWIKDSETRGGAENMLRFAEINTHMIASALIFIATTVPESQQPFI